MTNAICNTVSNAVSSNVRTSVQNQNQNQTVLTASCGVSNRQIHPSHGDLGLRPLMDGGSAAMLGGGF